MIFGEGVLGIALLFLWIFCIFDVISSEPELVRNLPKLVWLLIVIIVPDVIPAIIDRETFARAGAALARGVFLTRPGARTNAHLFTHMLVCGECGAYLRRREEGLKRKDEGDA